MARLESQTRSRACATGQNGSVCHNKEGTKGGATHYAFREPFRIEAETM